MDLIPVRFRDCSCPGTPHPDGDIAELRPFLGYAAGAEAQDGFFRGSSAAIAIVQADPTRDLDQVAELQVSMAMIPIFIRHGVVSWNVVDENGPVRPTQEALDALPYADAYEIGSKANDLYGAQVLAPLAKATAALTKAGRTGSSTPPRRRSSQRPRKPSPRSSTRNSASDPSPT